MSIVINKLYFSFKRFNLFISEGKRMSRGRGKGKRGREAYFVLSTEPKVKIHLTTSKL